MSNPAQPEPSMEEILASIRRIISEDPATAPAAAPAPAPVVLTAEQETPYKPMPLDAQPTEMADTIGADDVFELTPDMRAETFAPAPEPVAAEPAPQPLAYEPEPKPMAYTHTPPEEDNFAGSPLMSPQTEAIASAALAGFTSSITSRHGFTGNTVEDIVRELLRPMLREWMDNNLPTLVERLVEVEIERLARRRG